MTHRLWTAKTLSTTTALGATAFVAFAASAFAQDSIPMGSGQDLSTMCGTKPAVVALADGFGGNTWRRTALAELRDEASKCPNITEVLYTDATGDPAKATSDINSLVAQGVNIIVVYPDFGEATLPAIRAAHDAGVTIIPYNVDLPGEPGEFYAANITQDHDANAARWTEWLHNNVGEAKALYFSGIAGNSFSNSIMEKLLGEFQKYAGLEMLEDQFIATNWSNTDAQKAAAGVIAQYGNIDAFVTDFGPVQLGIIRAFQQAGLKVPANVNLASNNEVNCLWLEAKAKGEEWPYYTLEGTTSLVRHALRRGMASYQGTENSEPYSFQTNVFADSAAGKDPLCDKSAPLDADLSGMLSVEKLQEVFQQ
jgi:ribose transport system substrate-binding protein